MITSSNSTYITDLIEIQDKVLDAAIDSLQKCDEKHKKSTSGLTEFPKNTLQLDYTLNGKVLSVLYPLKDPSMFSRT